MNDINFRINGRIEIYYNEEYFKCSIQDVEEEAISISIPVKDSVFIPLHSGENIEVLYYEEGNIYKFNSTVLNRKFDQVPTIGISSPTKIIKIQRRQFVRVAQLKDIKYAKLNNDAKKYKENLNNIYAKGTMTDLSGGGARVKVNEELKIGDNLLVNLNIEQESMSIKSTVVRVDKYDSQNIECGLSFSGVEENDREKLIKYIFSQMRNQMRNQMRKS